MLVLVSSNFDFRLISFFNVNIQAREKAYDLEANLALLKLYQFNPTYSNLEVVMQILLKSLTNLPHTDFVLCKCLLSQEVLEDPQVNLILDSYSTDR